MPDRAFFDRIVGKVINFEGGHSTDRHDGGNWTGGEVGQGELKGTKYGVSAASFPELDIASITKEQASRIYYERYWLPSGAADLPKPLAFLHFDSAVQHGVEKAKEFLAGSNDHPLRYLAHRIDFYTDLSKFDRYGKGWMNRIAKLMAEMDELDREQDLDPYKLVFDTPDGGNAVLPLDATQHVLMRMAPDRKRIYVSVKESPDA